MQIIKLYIRQFRFTLKLIPTLLFLIAFSILVLLGFWQLQRAEQKKILLNDYQQRPQSKSLQLSNLYGDLKSLQYYALQVSGHYDNQHNILLDNKSYQHKIGYQVLTPFILNNKRAILINRGWIPRKQNRQDLPVIPPVVGQQTINGLIYLPRKTFLLGAEFNAIRWPLISQSIDVEKFANILQKNFYPIVLLLASDQPNGFVRNWNPVTTTPYKNLGYAVQWFSLAMALLIIFIAVNTRREKHEK